MLGTDSAEVSGIAIQAKQNRGVVMIQVPLDNLRKARQYLAERVLSLLQTFYTEERVIMVTNEDIPTEPREEVAINVQTPEGRIINDLTLGEYDVIVSTSPARDSFDEIQFAEALNLRQAGVAIPDDAIVQYSHLAKKEELAERIRATSGQAPPTPQEAEMMQMQQQMEMQRVQLELAKLEAEVRHIQTESALNVAKVQDTADVNPQLRVAELQAKIQLKQEELELRRQLSAATNEVRTNQQTTQAATRIAATAMQTAAKRPEPTPPARTNIPNAQPLPELP
jgi:hypothetical protein